MSFRRFFAYIVLAALPCVLLWPVLAGQVLLPANLLHDIFPWRTNDPRSLVPWNVLQFDGIAEFYPWRLFAARAWHAGYVPLWNPYEFCGTPFLANSQSAVLYPPNALFAAMPAMYAFGISALLHLFATGAFLYLFLRRACGLCVVPALLGAVVWQLSTWQISWLALPTFLDTSCWIPLCLLLADRLAERPSIPRAGALGAVLGLMLLAGHLQIAFYGLLLVLCYGVFCAVRRRMTLPAAVGYAVVAGGLMLLIAAPQALPTIELSRVSHRAGGHVSAAGYAAYVGLALPARHLVTLFLPGFFGQPQNGTYWDDPRMNFAEVACYVGVPALILALAGTLCAWRASSQVRFFTIAAAVAMLMALGTPLDALLYFGIPGFGQTGSPARVLVLWALCLAALAGFGLQALLDRQRPKAVWAAFGIGVALCAAAFGEAYLWMGRMGVLSNLSALGRDMRLFAALLLAAGAIALLYLRGTVSRPVAASLLVGLVAADLLVAGWGYNPMVAPSDVYPKTPLTTWLSQNAHGERVMPVNHSWSLSRPPKAILPPNAATVYELAETQGYDSLQTGRYMAFAGSLNSGRPPSPPENGNIVFTYGAGSRQARAANARYIVSLTPLAGLGTPVFSDGAAVVYEDAKALPRARIAVGSASITDLSCTRQQIHYTGQGDLVVADQWYPGWRARINEKPCPIQARPDVFLTVPNLAGPSGTVHLRYEPATFRLGLYLGCLGMLILSAMVQQSTVSRRKGMRG